MNQATFAPVPVKVADRIAGFVVADAARLRFVAADRRFDVLDGSRFSHVRDAQRAADRLARTALDEAGPERRHGSA